MSLSVLEFGPEWGNVLMRLPAGATLVDNFTIKGNSLGTLNWQGNSEWNTGFGVNSKNEQLECGARFKLDVNNYLNTSGSRYKTVQVSCDSWKGSPAIQNQQRESLNPGQTEQPP